MAYDAVLRRLAVIGEAVEALPDLFKAEYPDTPWASIAGLRNVVVHGYFRVNHDLIRERRQPTRRAGRVVGWRLE